MKLNKSHYTGTFNYKKFQALRIKNAIYGIVAGKIAMDTIMSDMMSYIEDATKENDKKYIVKFYDWIGGFSDRPSYSGNELLLDETFKHKFMELYCTTRTGPYGSGYELNKRGKAKYGTDYVSIYEIKENQL